MSKQGSDREAFHQEYVKLVGLKIEPAKKHRVESSTESAARLRETSCEWFTCRTLCRRIRLDELRTPSVERMAGPEAI